MGNKTQNLLVLARRAKENGDNGTAAQYYQQLLLEEPDFWEAIFYSDFCTAADCVILEIGPSAKRIANAFVSTFNVVCKNYNSEQRDAILHSLADESIALLTTLSTAALEYYKQNMFKVDGANKEFNARAYECGMAICVIGDCFYNISDKRVAAICYKKAPDLWQGLYELNDIAIERIKEYDPEYNIGTSKRGCYVATCVYGSYDCPQVWTLRRYRDNILAKTWYGRAFIHTYYAISPTLVKWFGNTTWFKKMWQGKLDRMVADLREQGIESTPYEDKNW